MGEGKPKTFEDLIINSSTNEQDINKEEKKEAEKLLLAKDWENFLAEHTDEEEKTEDREHARTMAEEQEEDKSVVTQEERDLLEGKKESSTEVKNMIDTKKTSEIVKGDLAKLQEEIKNREEEKQKAKESVGRFQNLSARLGIKGSEAKETEKSRRSNAQVELERAVEELKEMMSQKNQFEQEKLNQIKESKSKFMKAVDKYNKLPLKYKIAITAGLIGGGAVAGMAGGSTAVAGSLVLGSFKVFDSIAAGIGAKSVVEHLGKRKKEKIEKGTMEEMQAELKEGKDLETVWKEKTAKMNERIEKSQEKYEIIAKWVGVDVGIGTFLLSGGYKDFANVWKLWRADQVVFGAGESLMQKGAQQTAEKTGVKGVGIVEKTGSERPFRSLAQRFHKTAPIIENTKMAEQSFEAVAKKGDTVWGLMKENLVKNPEFAKLDKTGQTRFLETLRRKIASNPESIGMAKGANIDKIAIGQKLNFQKVFGDKGAIQQIFEKAKNLSPEKMANAGKGVVEKAQNVVEKVSVKPYTGGGLTKIVETMSGGQKVVENLAMSAADRLKIVQPVNSLWSRMVGQSDKGFFAENLAKLGEGKSFFARNEWGSWKNMDMERILNSSFVSEREGIRLLERSHRESFVRFLKMLRRTVPPIAGKKETILEYLSRAQSTLK